MEGQVKMRDKKVLYVIHYGHTLKEFYCDSKTNKPKKIIGDGGSNIHIHLIQYLAKNGAKISLSTFKNNYQCIAFFGSSLNVKITPFWTPQSLLGRYNFFIDNVYKLFFLPIKTFFINTNYDYLVSTTDFLPDVIYSFLIKIRNPGIKWFASYFLEAPRPWVKNNPYKTNFKRYLTGVLYWLAQRPSYWLIKWKADFVLVTSEPDVKKFVTRKRQKEKIIVVQGGVDISEAKEYLDRKVIISAEKRKYDACFMGRFHYQKGVLELVDIWKSVCQEKPKAKLVMIGNGPLEAAVKKKIKKYNLEKNIYLLGFKSGKDKYEIFKQAKIMVHPATYDSGGMASAEGMAWGLPGVSFDLESLKTYYPKGMIKTKCFDFKEFAENILKLLNDRNFYNEMSKHARDLIVEVWDWNKRMEIIYEKIIR